MVFLTIDEFTMYATFVKICTFTVHFRQILKKICRRNKIISAAHNYTKIKEISILNSIKHTNNFKPRIYIQSKILSAQYIQLSSNQLHKVKNKKQTIFMSCHAYHVIGKVVKKNVHRKNNDYRK